MSIIVVGASHRSAPLSVLEPLGIPAGDTAPFLGRLKQSFREVLALSTCNRTEVYAVSGHARSGWDLLLQALAERVGCPGDELRPHIYAYQGADAVRHALRVASGLESLVLGEDQIQFQWKRALAHARVSESLGPILDRLGASALSCGKRVRTFTGVGRHSVSLESLAVRAAGERLGAGGFAGRRALLIGAGESASLVLRHLLEQGPRDVTVMSRSLDKAEVFATANGVTAVPIDAIEGVLPAVDAVFCCTAAPHPVLGCAHFARWQARERARPLVCVDLGMPRDIEEAVASISSVEIIDLAALASLADAHREERRAHVPAAEEIVAAETARFMDWRAARGTAATVSRLHAHARSIADLETDVALARLAHLDARDREIVAALGRRIVNKLLHAPSVALRGHAEGENIALALEYAFGLEGRQALDEALPHTALPVAPTGDPITETA